MAEGKLPERCRSCRYSAPVDVGVDSEMLYACVYILRKYERRPCPAGDDCTVYEKAEGKRAHGETPEEWPEVDV